MKFLNLEEFLSVGFRFTLDPKPVTLTLHVFYSQRPVFKETVNRISKRQSQNLFILISFS